MKKAMPLPLDIRLMNMTAASLTVVFVLLLLAGGAWWLLRHPVFSIQAITVQGDVTTEAGRAALLAACPDPDILITNAGGPPQGEFSQFELDDWRRAVEANTPNALATSSLEGDGVLIAAAQKVEHYEIASYGCLHAWAVRLGNDEAADILQEILDEEKAANDALSDLALERSNDEALDESDAEAKADAADKKPAAKKAAAGSKKASA